MSTTHDALVTLSNLSDADVLRMGVAALIKIAAGIELMQEPIPDPHKFDLAKFPNFDWSSIGAEVVQTDADGVALIRTEDGKLAKRGANDKFGPGLWFYYTRGKKPDGTPNYIHVVKFIPLTGAEPLGRKTADALAQATSSNRPEPPKAGTNTSPLMPHLLERYQALAKELDGMGELVPADLTIGIDTTPPIAQGVLDKLTRYVAQKRDAHRPPGHSAPAGAGDGPLAAAKAWLADSGRRANAENMTAFAAELQRHMTACGCVLTTKEPNLNRKRDAFAAWILEQVPA